MSRVICHKSTSWENTLKFHVWSPCFDETCLMKVEASRTMEQLENFHVGKAGVYRHAWFIKKDGGRFEFWLPSKQQQVGLLKLRHNLHLWNRYWRRGAMQIFRKSSLQSSLRLLPANLWICTRHEFDAQQMHEKLQIPPMASLQFRTKSCGDLDLSIKECIACPNSGWFW